VVKEEVDQMAPPSRTR